METYSVTQVARFLDVSVGTVRTDGRDFSEFLSAAANPGHGQERRFNDEDLAVLQTVRVLRNQNRSLEEIIDELKKGTRLEPAEAPPDIHNQRRNDEAPEAGSAALVNQLMATVARFEGELEATRNERDRLMAERDREREKVDSQAAALLDAEKRAAAAEARAQFLVEQIEELKNAAAAPPTLPPDPEQKQGSSGWLAWLLGRK